MADMQDFLSLAPLVWAPAETLWNLLSRVTAGGWTDVHDTREKQRLFCERNAKNETTCRKAQLTDRGDRSSKQAWQPQPQQAQPAPRGAAAQALPSQHSRATGPMTRILDRAVSSTSVRTLDTAVSKPQAAGGKLLETLVPVASEATGRGEGNLMAINASTQAPSNQNVTEQAKPPPRGAAAQALPARHSRATGPVTRMLERAVSSMWVRILGTAVSKPQTPVPAASEAAGHGEGNVVATNASKQAPSNQNVTEQATGRGEGNVVAINASKQAPSNQNVTGRAGLVKQPKQDVTQAAIDKPLAVRSWNEAKWERVKKLQEAKRNSGCVDLMRSLESGRFVAVKRMPTEWVCTSAAEFSNKYPRSAEKPWVDIEVTTFLHSIGYPHVCEPLGVFADGVDTYVVSEFASSGDLFTWCHKQKARPGLEREALIRPVVQQVCLAVAWLHECGIAHRDLSLENLVLTRNQSGRQLEVKLIDFGMATLERTRKCEACGKLPYQAPEMHGDGVYDTFLADSFALGVTFYCMASGDYPWLNTRPGKESDAVFRYVMANGLDKYFQARKVRGKGKRLVEVFSPELVHFLKCLMAPDPSVRFTSRELYPAMLEEGWLSQE